MAASLPDLPEQQPQASALLQSLSKDIEELGNFTVGELRGGLEHYLSLPIPEIQARTFKNENPEALLRDAFPKLEEEFNRARKNLLRPRPEDEIVVRFPDGWAWWRLPRASCPDEADAMGHCGNSP